MGLFASLKAALTGKHTDRDPEVVALKAAKTARLADDQYDQRADMQLARHLAMTGRLEEALAEVRDELAVVMMRVGRFFPQCTAKERRALAAMSRHTIYQAAAAVAGGETSTAAAYAAIAHAWWICGLALDGARKSEIARARTADAWRAAVGQNAAELGAWAAEQGAPKTEALVEVFAAAAWRQQQLSEAHRLKA